MPEIISILTEVTCDRNSLVEVIYKFRYVLERIHCVTPQVNQWLSSIDWPLWEVGYSVHFPLVDLHIDDDIFPLRPFIEFSIREEEEQWDDKVVLGIFFEAAPLRDEDMHFYNNRAVMFLCNLLNIFYTQFHEKGVFLTNENQGVEVLKAINNNTKLFWIFDAAVVPIEICNRFQPAPNNFLQVYFDNVIGFINQDDINTSPWQ